MHPPDEAPPLTVGEVENRANPKIGQQYEHRQSQCGYGKPGRGPLPGGPGQVPE